MEPGRSEETQARTTAEAAQAHEKTEARWAFLKSVLKATSNWHRKTEGRGTEDRETEDRVPGRHPRGVSLHFDFAVETPLAGVFQELLEKCGTASCLDYG